MQPSALPNFGAFSALQIETKTDFKAQQIRERSKIAPKMMESPSLSEILEAVLKSYRLINWSLTSGFFCCCAESLLLCTGFSLAAASRGYSRCGAQISHCSGLSCLGFVGFSSFSSQPLEHRLSS